MAGNHLCNLFGRIRVQNEDPCDSAWYRPDGPAYPFLRYFKKCVSTCKIPTGTYVALKCIDEMCDYFSCSGDPL